MIICPLSDSACAAASRGMSDAKVVAERNAKDPRLDL